MKSKNLFYNLIFLIVATTNVESTVLVKTIENYLNLEKTLWSDVMFHMKEQTIRTDDVGVLDQIRFAHLQFLTKKLTGFEMEYNLFLLRDEFVFENIVAINKSVSKALNTYLTDSDILNDELKTILITNYQVDLSKQMDDIFEFMSTDGFQEFMQGVSRCNVMRNEIF